MKRLKAELTELQADLARVDHELSEYKAREKEILSKEKELVKSQQILARQQQTDETLKINAHLNTLEAKLRQATQEKAELQAQLKSFLNGEIDINDESFKSLCGSSGKKITNRSNSMPVTPGRRASTMQISNTVEDRKETESSLIVITELNERLAESEESIKELNQALEEAQEELMTKCQ